MKSIEHQIVLFSHLCNKFWYFMNEYKDIVFNTLKKLITDNYILIDLPYHQNVGDILIWQSELDLLKKIPFSMLYSYSIETFLRPVIEENVIILIHGGGNFGDIWKKHQDFRLKILEYYPNNPIVQLPQSVYFGDSNYLSQNITAFSKHHGKIDICLRDKKSYDFVNKHFKGINTHLIPDMALTLDINRYRKKCDSSGTLYIKRNDIEYIPKKENIFPKDITICDWPYHHYNKIISKLINFDIRYHTTIGRKTADLTYKNLYKDLIIRNGINLIERYDTIYTSRLHGGILAFLLGKKVIFLKNEYYGKIEGVYDLWLKGKPNVNIL